LYGVIGHRGLTTEFSPGAGFTVLGAVGSSGSGNRATEPEFQIVSATGAYAATGTFSASRAWGAAILTLKCAGGAPPPTPTPTPGSCCAGNFGPGCNDATCQSCVCGVDAFCCDTQWDDQCAAEAADPAVCGLSCPCQVPTP